MNEAPLPPSPGSAEHVSIDLINSEVRLPGDRSFDALHSPKTTTAWLIERGLIGDDAALQAYCRNRLVGLRGDLHAAFESRVDGTAVDPRVLDGINAALTAAPNTSFLRYTPGSGYFRALDHPTTQLVEHAMSIIAEDAATLLSSDEAALLARCDADPCTRFFVKTHGRRQWCCTRCGDRVRAARAYARKRDKVAS